MNSSPELNRRPRKTKEKMNRLLYKEDLFPANHYPKTFTEAESNLAIFIILFVIAMLLLVPVAELIR
ncbi:MAG: hypothetical protein PHY93_01505 [Bacteriovorax sp.]|nr:hypothetical protein [Bacteriovorax sp.]